MKIINLILKPIRFKLMIILVNALLYISDSDTYEGISLMMKLTDWAKDCKIYYDRVDRLDNMEKNNKLKE